MKTNLKKLSMILLAVILATGFVFISCDDIIDGAVVEGIGARATTITNNATGNHDGYDYELWKDNGNVSMTLENGGNFSCQWSNIGNMLCRKGKKFGASQTYSQIGNITIKYDAQFTPGGNSYLCVYGWSKDPLVEYYIIESYGTYKPTGTNKGSVSIDGGTYELYETTRNNQPSIEGTKTFKQFWSVRTSKRTSGTISVTEHFKAWDSKGMKLGKIYEAALTVEGYQSSGNAKITSHTLTVGGSSSSTSTGSSSSSSSSNNNTSSGGTVSSTTTSSGATKIEAENMTKGGKYTGSCSSPFNGVKLYANDDKVSFSQNFSNNSHTFKVRGASSNDKEAQVQLKIGGTSYGTFKFKGTSASEQSITASHNQGGKTATVELICVNDNDTWDVMIDWIEISASSGGSTGTTNTNTNTSTNNNTSNNTTSSATSSGATKVEAENMTKGGKYTGSCSSPFNGVTLYANDDKVSFSQQFGNNKHAFKVRGASTNDKEAQVQLKVGGTVAGTFKFKGTSATEQTIEFQHNKSGQTVTIELVCVNDNDTWDVKIDWIEMTAK
jgi:hypothetical protein